MDNGRPMNHEPMDEPGDDSLRDLVARGYNTPDADVPREEMWARIAAARRASRGAPATRTDRSEHEDRAVTPVTPLHRPQRTIWRWSAALAAGLVLGIAVDRGLVRRAGTPDMRVSQAPDAAPGSAPTTPSARGSESVGVAVPSTPSAGEAPSTRGGSRSVPPSASSRVALTVPETSAGAQALTNPARPDPRDLYHAAAVQTLVQAEALLTAYRRTGDAAPDPQAMQQAAMWARDVLSSTRLLMDSPAARDPRMRVLFTDLELVLAQIVQLSGAPLQASERELIARALRERDLLPRLRSAVPAGLTTS